MGVEHGHDLITRYNSGGSITPGIKTPADYDSAFKTTVISRIRYAFCFVQAVTGAQLRCQWLLTRIVSPFDVVAIPLTQSALITPVAGTYFTRLSSDALGHELAFPSPASEFGAGDGNVPSIGVRWTVTGGTNIVAAFWEVEVPGENKTPSFEAINGAGTGRLEKDSNDNDRMLSDFGTFPANSLIKPAGNGTLT